MTLLVLYGGEVDTGLLRDTSDIPDAPVRAANLIVAADQVIGMLFTVTVGIVVGAGFIFRDRDFRGGFGNALQLCLAVALMLSVIFAVYFGYAARMHSLRVAHYSLTEYVAINQLIGRQAFSVVVAAGAALGLFALYLAEKQSGHQPVEASTPLAAAQPAPAAKRATRPRRKPSEKSEGADG